MMYHDLKLCNIINNMFIILPIQEFMFGFPIIWYEAGLIFYFDILQLKIVTFSIFSILHVRNYGQRRGFDKRPNFYLPPPHPPCANRVSQIQVGSDITADK
jgi:hypothetical protein